MKATTKKLLAGSIIGATMVAGSAGVLVAQEKPVISTVVKISGIPWFDRMNTGVEAYQKANPDVVATQSGPATSDAAQQLQIVQDLVAKGVTALAVVPMDPAVLEGTFKRAMERGIVVVTHEADNQINTMADVEAFDNSDYGTALNERLAQCMNNTGKWTTFVGSLGSRTHMQWVASAEENAKKYPEMQLVDPNNESFDDANGTYEKAKEILRKHPDLKGFQTSAGNDVLGIGRAIDEAGLSGKVCLVGTGLPNPSADLLESGAITAIGFWDPQKAGMAMNALARMFIEKKEVKDGTDLGVEGYNSVRVKKGAGEGLLVIGNGMVIADKATYKEHLF
ncbi:substrate-binding domain-containing protein [Pseudochrobactrum asaccharolyticum]|jgi:simple sugar transport system substrate-binding protein|uniref:Monosaccharide ABC transporter substrate-binding protein (CUT2 family) n=1 Tax=Pseudochrobactrum asaccharolyticum TaxID=354351 RepID=A0A366E0J9_9HYPH|nr:substrate-binding domain-containing protein [Pseudochrobactrum asaccharolyticum]MDR2310839.1 substrate-binding domain-containing protein [Brucellaceae bacterium]RBO95896.1 monosaccharide ABC transporter substrate-binding protein (CUT2 family) [Pseudochrobactrum asaccharolyticum]